VPSAYSSVPSIESDTDSNSLSHCFSPVSASTATRYPRPVSTYIRPSPYTGAENTSTSEPLVAAGTSDCRHTSSPVTASTASRPSFGVSKSGESLKAV